MANQPNSCEEAVNTEKPCARTLLHRIRRVRSKGYQKAALAMRSSRNALRTEILEGVAPFCSPHVGVGLVWEPWGAPADALYDQPMCVQMLSDLLELYFAETCLEQVLENDVDRLIKRLARLTESYLKRAKSILDDDIENCVNAHQWVHIQEVYTTFYSTLLQAFDALLDYPEKAGFETTPQIVEFVCSPKLSGLIRSSYLFVVGRERLRPPSEPNWHTDRRGSEISYEEISNIYRTTRVSISNIVKKGQNLMSTQLDSSHLFEEVGLYEEEEEITGVADDLYSTEEAKQYLKEDFERCLEHGMTGIPAGNDTFYREADLERYGAAAEEGTLAEMEHGHG